MKQGNKNLTLNKETVSNLKRDTISIKGGAERSILPCFTIWGRLEQSCLCEI